MDFLRQRLASLFPRRQAASPAAPAAEKANPIAALIAKYHQAGNDEEKTLLLDQIFARFSDTLFLASVCFPGDDPSRPVTDRTLHCSQGAKRLYDKNQGVVMRGNPGYNPGKRDSDKEMHLRTLVSKSSGQTWIPLFTDFSRYTPCFGSKTRAALFTIREVKAMCQPGQGILIDPGENALPLTAEDLKRIR